MRLKKLLQTTTFRATYAGGAVMLLMTAMAAPVFAALPPKTPEIDPGSIAAAITLFVGGTMYLSSRRRMK